MDYRSRVPHRHWDNIVIPDGYIPLESAHSLVLGLSFPSLKNYSLDARYNCKKLEPNDIFSYLLKELMPATSFIKIHPESEVWVWKEHVEQRLKRRKAHYKEQEETILGAYQVEDRQALKLYQENWWNKIYPNIDQENQHIAVLAIWEMVKKELLRRLSAEKLNGFIITEKGKLIAIAPELWRTNQVYFSVFEKLAYFEQETEGGFVQSTGLIVIATDGLKSLRDEIIKIMSEKNDADKNSRESPRKNQIDKQICQAVALTLWHINPDFTIEEIRTHYAIQEIAGGKNYPGKNTLRDWLGEVDPRPQDAKRGRKKKLPADAA